MFGDAGVVDAADADADDDDAADADYADDAYEPDDDVKHDEYGEPSGFIIQDPTTNDQMHAFDAYIEDGGVWDSDVMSMLLIMLMLPMMMVMLIVIVIIHAEGYVLL